MEIFAETKDESKINISNLELLFSKKELDEYIEALINFQMEVDEYIKKNNTSRKGFTHMHYQDCIHSWKIGDPDFVIYVNMDELELLARGEVKDKDGQPTDFVELNPRDVIKVHVEEVSMSSGKRLFWNLLRVDKGLFEFSLAGTVR